MLARYALARIRDIGAGVSVGVQCALLVWDRSLCRSMYFMRLSSAL